jgi:hypothetical protein
MLIVPLSCRDGMAGTVLPGGPGAAERRLYLLEHCCARWLGDLDSNQGCPGQSREFYR